MYKEYMLKCECWNPLEGIWKNTKLFFDTEEEMRTKLNKRPMSMLQAFHSLGIDLGSSLVKFK